MLRVTRRAGERIIVGGEVVIEVLEVRGATVRLGIDAPRSVSIYREELWLEIKQENEAAARAPADWPELPVRFPEPAAAAGLRSSSPAPRAPDAGGRTDAPGPDAPGPDGPGPDGPQNAAEESAGPDAGAPPSEPEER